MRTFIVAAAIAAVPTLGSAQYGTPPPAYGTAPPAYGTSQPGYGTAEPGYRAAPGYGTPQPGYGAAQPGANYQGNYPYQAAPPPSARADMPPMASSRLDPENCGTPYEPKACPPMPRRPLQYRPDNRD